jgi:hypothetical protein
VLHISGASEIVGRRRVFPPAPRKTQATFKSAAALALLVCTATASATSELHVAIQLEPVHVEIDLNGVHPIQEILIDDILIAVHIELLIRIVRLIQSHGQAGAASATFVEKNTNRPHFLILEICRYLFSGRRCYFEHGVLLKKFQLHFTSAVMTADGWPADYLMPLRATRP